MRTLSKVRNRIRIAKMVVERYFGEHIRAFSLLAALLLSVVANIMLVTAFPPLGIIEVAIAITFIIYVCSSVIVDTADRVDKSVADYKMITKAMREYVERNMKRNG